MKLEQILQEAIGLRRKELEYLEQYTDLVHVGVEYEFYLDSNSIKDYGGDGDGITDFMDIDDIVNSDFYEREMAEERERAESEIYSNIERDIDEELTNVVDFIERIQNHFSQDDFKDISQAIDYYTYHFDQEHEPYAKVLTTKLKDYLEFYKEYSESIENFLDTLASYEVSEQLDSYEENLEPVFSFLYILANRDESIEFINEILPLLHQLHDFLFPEEQMKMNNFVEDLHEKISQIIDNYEIKDYWNSLEQSFELLQLNITNPQTFIENRIKESVVIDEGTEENIDQEVFQRAEQHLQANNNSSTISATKNILFDEQVDHLVEKVVEDSSLKNGFGVEVITKPSSFNDVYQEQLETFFNIIDQHGWTDDTCGLHFNMSVQDVNFNFNNINYGKLMLSINEEYIRNFFEIRNDNVRNVLNINNLIDFIKSYQSDGIEGLKEYFNLLVRDKAIKGTGVNVGHMVKTENQRIEFRYPGGMDYERDLETIQYHMKRFAIAVLGAFDPDFMEKEYEKDLIRLLNKKAQKIYDKDSFISLVKDYEKGKLY